MASSRKSPVPESAERFAVFEDALTSLLQRAWLMLPATTPPTLAVAYSGGIDSSALLWLASRHAATHQIPLHAFHIHHGLSPHADAWLAHCRQTAAALGVPFAARQVSLPSVQLHGTEEAARLARYQALGELCRTHGSTLLLTAHHQDDQAETLLLQLLRGAGLPGLSAMPDFQARHELLGPGVILGRPLLQLPRKQLEQLCQTAGLACVEDESNVDPRFRRNALRHQVFPSLETHFPGFRPLLARSARHAQAAQGLLQELAEIDLQACQTNAGGKLRLSSLQALSPDRADNLLRHWLARQGVTLPSTAQLRTLRTQMLQAGADRHPFLDLGNVRLQRAGGLLEIRPRPTQAVSTSEEVWLQWSGEARLPVPQWGGTLYFVPAPEGGLSRARLLQHPLHLRHRSGQERLKPAPNRPSKSLKNLFQETGIPAPDREGLPLIYLEDALVFVPGLGMDVRQLCREPDALALHWAPGRAGAGPAPSA